MRRLPLLLAAAAALAGCGSTTVKTVTVHRPPNLGPARAEAADPGATPAKGARYTSASGCGVERWAVKTLTDPAANQVNLTPVSSTVAALRALPAPARPTDRVAPVEATTYQLSGTIVFAKQEADGDVHLVLEDGAGQTMIVESPNPSCASGSIVASQIAAVRQAVDQQFSGAAAGQAQSGLAVAVTVTGVGFFDRLHGQTGVAPNGIELHPLTSIALTGTKARAPALHLSDHTGAD